MSTITEDHRVDELYSDRVYLCEFIRKRLGERTVGAEIGVDRGRFAAKLIEHVNPHALFLVDTWQVSGKGPDVYDRERHEEALATVREACVRCHPKTPDVLHIEKVRFEDFTFDDLTKSARAKLPNPLLFDWLYLDAYHQYSYVRPQLDRAIEFVRPGGIIAGHDFRVEPGGWNSGVVRAVLELVWARKLKPLAITNEVYASYVCERV